MQLSDFQFPFDTRLIADHPIKPRDHARLLVVPRGGGPFSDQRILDLPRLLEPGDLLVVNDTKVIPARLRGYKLPGGGNIEVLLVKAIAPRLWQVLLKGKVHVGQSLHFEPEVHAVVVERSRHRTVLEFSDETALRKSIEKHGLMPLPPYIKRAPTEEDRTDYQTVFATTEGAVAAPTAGLHFTPRLIEALHTGGVRFAAITLHVGPGTFRPVTSATIQDHQMEPEWYRIPEETAQAIAAVRRRGGRVIAVGTTVTRTLEAAARDSRTVRPGTGETRLFITPGFQFQIVDGLLTNFHLPGTTLVMLVAAFAGMDQARSAYAHAVALRYRFYSYGDAMLIV